MKTDRSVAVVLAAVVLAVAACGGGGGPYDPGSTADCVTGEVDNYVRRPLPPTADPPSWLRPRLSESGLAPARWVAFRPFDITFGEVVDGVITAPAPAVFVFFDSAAAAERHAQRADLARSNLLVFYEREPTPLQREAIEDCL